MKKNIFLLLSVTMIAQAHAGSLSSALEKAGDTLKHHCAQTAVHMSGNGDSTASGWKKKHTKYYHQCVKNNVAVQEREEEHRPPSNFDHLNLGGMTCDCACAGGNCCTGHPPCGSFGGWMKK